MESEVTMRGKDFACNCKDGITDVLAPDRVLHSCGFRPSRTHSEVIGVTYPYRRVQINPELTGGAEQFNWFREWD